MGVTRIPALTTEVVETDPTALKIANNLSDLPAPDTARSNIGHFAGPSAVVGPVGADDITHTSIQQAHDDLVATGGLVEIRPGTYTEDLILTSPNVHYRGHASHGGTTVVGACTISIGVNPGDAATSHQIEMENIIFTPAAAQVDPVVTVSGNPARTWMRNVRIRGSDEACDALRVNIPDGQVALDGCHVWHSAGGTGTPLSVSNGTVRVGPNCAFEHPSGGYAIELSGTGAVWGTATDTLLTGRVQNVGAGNGSFAAYFPGLTVTAPDDPVFTSNGAGAIVLGLLAVTAPTGGQAVAEGAGGFVWSPDSTALTLAANPTAVGHLDPAATLNAGLGPLAARTRGYQTTRQVTAGGADGQVLTADGLGNYAWENAAGGETNTLAVDPAATGADPTSTKSGTELRTKGILGEEGIQTDTVGADVRVRQDINSLTEDATPDTAVDFVVTYDASAGSHKKVRLDRLPGGGGGGGDVDLTAAPVDVWLDYNPQLNHLGDSSPNSFAATIISAPTTVTENGIQVASYTSDVIHFPLNEGGNKPAEWTILAVVNVTNIGSFQHICGSRNSAQTNSSSWGVIYNRDTPSAADGGLRVIWGDGANASRIDTDDPVFPEGGWVVVAVRFTSGIADVDVNANGDNETTTVTEGAATTTEGAAQNFFIGWGGNNSTQPLQNGRIARLFVLNRRMNDDDFFFWRRWLRYAYRDLYLA